MTVLMLALKIILFIAIGILARRLKVMPDGFDRMLTRFLMGVPLPCMIVNSFLSSAFSTDELRSFPMIIGLALVSMLTALAFSQLVYIRMGRNGVARSARFALLFTNFTFFGFAVVSELYGAQGTLYYVVFTLPIRVLFYGGAPLLLGSEQRMSGKELLKKFLCEPVVAVLIGFSLYVTRIHLPALITEVMSTLGGMASPLGLMLCGAIIADAEWKGVLRYPSAFWVSALRLLVMPALAMGLFLLLGVEHEIIRTVVFYFAMPVASFLPTFCLRYDPEETEGRLAGGYMVVVSTLLCVLTVPLWALLLDRLL